MTNTTHSGFRAIDIADVLGVRIEGLQLATQVSDDAIRSLQTVWDEKLVLLLRNQQLTDDQLPQIMERYNEKLGSLASMVR